MSHYLYAQMHREILVWIAVDQRVGMMVAWDAWQKWCIQHMCLHSSEESVPEASPFWREFCPEFLAAFAVFFHGTWR